MRRVVLQSAVIAVGYYAAAWVGIRMAVLPETASPVWPATGFAIAALAWVGPRYWPALFVGAFFAELPAFGVLGSTMASVGIVGEGALGAWLLRRSGLDHLFTTSRGVGHFLATMAAVPVLSAATGTMAVARLAGPSGLTEVAVTWYLGDLMGGLLVVPAVLLGLQRGPWVRRGPWEVVAFGLAWALAAFIGFYPWRPVDLEGVRLGFVAVVPIAWAAGRFGPLASSLTSIGVALAALWGLSQGTVQFQGSTNAELLQLQGLIGIMAMLGVLLASAVHQRESSMAQLRIHQAKLRDAMALIERSQQVKGAFLNKAAHELRTPMTPLRLQADILSQDASLSAESKVAVGRIKRNVDRLQQRVDDMVDAASLGRNDRALVQHELDVHDVLATAVADAHGVTPIHLDDTGVDCRVRADAGALARVLAQVLENAQAHTLPGGRIEVSCRCQGGWAEITVDDDGPGVADADKQRLFEPFTEGTEVRGTEGAGMGLYVVRMLITALGGEVRIEDAPMGGARFVIALQAAGARSTKE